MESPKTHVLKARVNLAVLLATLQTSLQYTRDVVSFGLIAADSVTQQTLQLPGAFFQMMPASNVALDFQTARSEFKKWVLMGGMRDCVEALNLFLDRTHPVCFLLSMGDRPEILAEDWNRGMVEESRSFHRKGLPAKIEHMEKKYGHALLPETKEEVLSINLARNCLVHRKGMVTEHDLNSDQGLLVKWRRIEISVSGSSGERVISSEAAVEPGEVVSMSHAKAQKLFKKGESLAFTVDEFAEVIWTLTLFGSQLVRSIEDYGRSHGVNFNSPKEALPE